MIKIDEKIRETRKEYDCTLIQAIVKVSEDNQIPIEKIASRLKKDMLEEIRSEAGELNLLKDE